MDSDEPSPRNDSPPPTMTAETPTTPASDPGTETPKIAHDSMVTVRLSEPPTLTLDTAVGPNAVATEPAMQDTDTDTDTEAEAAETIEEPAVKSQERVGGTPAPRDSTAALSTAETSRSLQDELEESQDGDQGHAGSSSDTDEVNWEQLEKTEDEQTKDEETDNSTALLLARLEQENAKLATNPKSVKVQSVDRGASRPRPPSIAQLREMINGPTPSALRYSMLPPPPMTDLEFYAALVKDYKQTAARLPTLLSNKIRKGIPPPLRGVVWQSMSGARDAALEEQYERFCGETSPYELIIGKDLGRSFPGVDMFRDPDGDGQRMLGRVLKSFSLYDTKIGYCQGLGFLVGPLLMHMPDKQAFCVLVRLMERYDLRDCFLPDLSGLHVRIYQFRELLRHNFPALSSHLEELQVDPAYVSQWFLSFFAVTCPLPMLFRIYDVIFAEGASETLMRVALSLMHKNEARLLACTELEDVMQLLLSRGLWDCYHYNADEFVQDFVSLTSEVTHEKLGQLENGYRQSLIATANAARASDITTAASRFLGRIWATSTTSISPKAATLSPGLSAPSRPLSMLRRSTSKQSLASTLNSMEASSASVVSSTSTDVTAASRDSSNTEDESSSSRESTPVGPKSMVSIKTTDEKYLHSQIEDLLMALSELQRNQALLSNQLQREREERDEDRKAVQSLLDGLRKKAGTDTAVVEAADETAEPSNASTDDNEDDGDGATPLSDATAKPMGNPEEATEPPSTEDLSTLLEQVESRFGTEDKKRRSSMLQSKAQLRDELAQARDQLANSQSQSQDLSRQIHSLDQEMTMLKDQLRESHSHARSMHQDKQRLERQIHVMRSRASSSSVGEPASREQEPDWPTKAGGASGGLRELKLGRSRSTPSQANGFGKRMSSLPVEAPALHAAPANEHDGILLELVQAKTAEAIAKQEAEEAKQKLEALRKAYGLTPGDSPAPAATPAAAAAAAMGVFGRLTGQATAPAAATDTGGKAATSTTAGSTASGGFWGWRR